MDISRYIGTFRDEIEENTEVALSLLPKLAEGEAGKDDLEVIRRSAHTMKSSALMMGFPKISSLCKGLEEVFARVIDGRLSLEGEIIGIAQKAFTFIMEQGKKISSADDDAVDQDIDSAVASLLS